MLDGTLNIGNDNIVTLAKMFVISLSDLYPSYVHTHDVFTPKILLMVANVCNQ